jgi:uncharacterized protein (TIGR03000 family)
MMRNTLLIVSLAVLTVLTSAGDAFAQRRGGYGGGYGGGWGGSPGISIGVGRGGYYSPYSNYGGRGYNSYQEYGYGNSYAPGYYYTTPSYYSAAPSYYAEPAYVAPTTQVRPTYYTAPAVAQQSVNMTVLVPTADAQVWFDNQATTQRGMERLFHSPPLEPNQSFAYTIKARWMENGQAVNRERRVNVQAGRNITVNFREDIREDVAPPLPNPIPRD